MAAFAVIVAPEAIAEVAKIATWWNENRPAAPRLFQKELDRAVVLLGDRPEIGFRVRSRLATNLRVLTLRRSRYLVFYRVDASAKEVTVLRIRHGSRRPLARPARRR